MQSKKTLAIFISSTDAINNIDIIYNFMHQDYDDFVIISDDNDHIDNKYAVIPSIHLKFFHGSVVFLSARSYLEKNRILSDNIYVVTSLDEIINNHISKNRLSGIKVINIQDKKIEVIKYDKL